MTEKERKLTDAELKRKEKFDKICEEMRGDGYSQKNLTVSIEKANFMAIVVMLPFVLLFFILYCVFIVDFDNITFYFKDFFILFVLVLVSCVLHEGIHGAVWGTFAKGHFKSIEFGIVIKALTPYCTCSEPLKKWQYIAGSAMPTIILGFIPAIVSLCVSSQVLMYFSLVMLLAGGGDFLIIYKILFYKTKGKAVVYYDHPYELGVVLFEK